MRLLPAEAMVLFAAAAGQFSPEFPVPSEMLEVAVCGILPKKPAEAVLLSSDWRCFPRGVVVEMH